MALSLQTIISSTVIRRRLPQVGALCVLTLGISNLYPPLSRTFIAHSLPINPLFRSKFGGSLPRSVSVRSVQMEASDKIVPSIVVYVTVPNREAGKKLAHSIVKEKLAACVNIVPGIESIYEWQGEIQSDNEELLIIKTRESLLPALTDHVKANHEYEVPEVIALPIKGGHLPYLEWLKNNTRDEKSE